MILIQALLIAGLVLVHLIAGKLRFLEGIPRSRWLSMACGVSVAYVFIHIFPDLQEAQSRMEGSWNFLPLVEHHVYLVALLGLSIFYGLERMVKSSQKRGESSAPGDGHGTPPAGVFWLHILSFGVYNFLIGYLLVHREEQDVRGLLFFFVALALHFLINDYGLRQDHKDTYERLGRWILSGAILIGWVAGLATQVNQATTDVLFAFLAGGIILNVLKEELPEERRSRFSAFALGAVAYAVLLLFL
jgi:zinc transporter ZupT